MNKDNNRIPLKSKISYFIIFIFIIAFAFCSFYYIEKGFDNVKIISVTYDSKSNVDYKVYLKENQFFEGAYLDKDKTYISSLIDYIDVMFNYELQFNQTVSGKYKYYVEGTIIAGKVDSMDDSNYWSKNYILKEPEIISFNNQKTFSVVENVKVDYQTYNDLLNSFKQEYGLAINGMFRLNLIIESESGAQLMKKSIPVKSVMELSIPLTEQTIELAFDTADNDNTDTYIERIELNDSKYKIFSGIGIVFEFLDVLLCIVLISSLASIFKHKSVYEKALKKILSSYDDIIITTRIMPRLSGIKIVHVNSFEDLIDAHSEIRMPINYVEDESGLKSDFILINSNMAWIYVLKDESYDKYIKRKEKEKKRKKTVQKKDK